MSVRPYVVFSPVTPHSDAGIRTEPAFPDTSKPYNARSNKSKITLMMIPPPSVPRAAGHSPEATIAAEPEEDPPVYLSGACGFLVVLQYTAYKVFKTSKDLCSVLCLLTRNSNCSLKSPCLTHAY